MNTCTASCSTRLEFSTYGDHSSTLKSLLVQIMTAEVDVTLSLSDPSVVATRFWHPLADGRIQCDLCPRACKLRERQRGLCFVRARMDNQVVMTSYGRSSGFCVDPIEKKPLNHFYPGSSVLSFGTAGCNLACKFCQNWDISKSRQMDSLMQQATPQAIASRARELGCKSVAFTYNDPVIFHEYAEAVAAACKAIGIKTVAVTAAYLTEPARAAFFSYIDAVNVDLKAFTEDFYYRLTGAQLQPVLECLQYLKHETSVWFEITTLLIPGCNDSDAEIDAMTQWLLNQLGAEVPLHFTAFHPDYKMLNTAATPVASLRRARDIALGNGLRYVYTGNVDDGVGGSSYCHHCRERVIERDWYQLGSYQLDSRGHCIHCGTAFPGHFDAEPGDWGRQRLSVNMA